MNTPQAGAGRLPLLSLRYAVRSSRVKILVIVMGRGEFVQDLFIQSRGSRRSDSGGGESETDFGMDESLVS